MIMYFGFAVSGELDRVLEAEEKRARAHETTHRYSLEEFGLKPDAIRKALAGLFARFEWEDAAAPPAAGPAKASDGVRERPLVSTRE